jgi:phosphoribosylformylglycinamidine cyclo-ligase
MNIDDMVCVGATGPYVMSNTIGRNAKTFPDEAMGAIIDGYSDTVEKLHDYGIHIRMAGGETADVGDLVRTAIVDSTFITRMRRDEVIDCSQVKPGHVIIGFASDGQASYEKFENSGMGSNGLTAARHLILKHASGMGERLAEKYPESYAPEIREKAYQGFYGVSDAFMATNPPITIAEAILSPTRIYAPVMKQVIEACRPAISAIFHNTGGGQAKCLKFGNGVSYDKLDPLPMAPLFQLLQRETQYPPEEMARTFNLGSRMEVICDEAAASEVLGIASAFNIKAKVIGEVTKFTQGERRLQLGGHWEKTLKLTAKCD